MPYTPISVSAMTRASSLHVNPFCSVCMCGCIAGQGQVLSDRCQPEILWWRQRPRLRGYPR